MDAILLVPIILLGEFIVPAGLVLRAEFSRGVWWGVFDGIRFTLTSEWIPYSIYTTPIEYLDLSVRPYNICRRSGIRTIGDLLYGGWDIVKLHLKCTNEHKLEIAHAAYAYVNENNSL